MENNLDKYFKDKLHEREFDFKDSYWAGAEKLLDAQERRRRRVLLFWWFGGVAGAVLLAATFWFLGKNEGQQESQSHAVELKENTLSNPEASQAIESNISESELPENNGGNDNQ